MDSDIPLSLPLVTKVVAVMMATTILGCGYMRCTDGTFKCDGDSFPDISHVMGQAPLNKLYAIVLSIYAFNKQAYVRAYNDALTGIASAGTQQLLLIYGLLSCICAPGFGFFDVYYDMTIHCIVVGIFVAGEVLYVLTVTSILNGARDKFPATASSSIDTLVTCRMIMIVLGVVTLGSKVLGYNINPYSSYIEWVLFNMSFFIFCVLSNIMPYDSKVVPQKDQ